MGRWALAGRRRPARTHGRIGRRRWVDLVVLPDPSAASYFLVYLLAAAKGNASVAEQAFGQALERMKNGDKEERAAVALLVAPHPVDAATLCAVGLDLEEKCVMLAALGVRDQAQREIYHAMAAKLDISLGFPHRFLATVLPPAAIPGS